MYIKDIHILCYFFIGLLGLAIGQILNWANTRLENHEKIFCKEFFVTYLPHMKINCKLLFSTAIIYVLLLYFIGWQIKLIEYLLLTPLLISTFAVDYKKQIIPNRLTLTIFELGIIFAFISGISSFNVFIDRILGAVVGAGIFLLISLIGGAFTKKDAMGYGDIKLMGALGLFFGFQSTIMISVISFLIGSIVSIILLIFKKKKSNEYIPFGPFIVIATLLVMFIPHNIMLFVLLKIFSLGFYKV